MKFVNLTPHEVKVGGRSLPSSGVARVSETLVHVADIECCDVGGTISVFSRDLGEVIDLPAPCSGVIYIVSSMVMTACPDRLDIAVPVGFERDDTGKIIGASGILLNKEKT